MAQAGSQIYAEQACGRPAAIRRVDGPVYFNAMTLAWAAKRGICIDFIVLGHPPN
jgi:putative transposase